MADKCAASLEFLREISPYIADGMENAAFGDVVKSFVSGSASVVSYTGRVADTIDRTAPDLVDKFTVAGYPTPEADMDPSNAVFINGWIIPQKADEADAANDFLDWFVKEKFIGWLLCNPFNTQPTLKTIYTNDEWLSDESIQKHPHMVEVMEAMVNEKGYRSSGIEVMPPGPGALKQKAISAGVVPDMFQKVVLKNEDPTSVVKEAADALRKL
jgi:ABC-type glycerol-3-phosphate transport system substrate-binding protein